MPLSTGDVPYQKKAGFGRLINSLGGRARENSIPKSAGYTRNRNFFDTSDKVAKGTTDPTDVIRRGEQFNLQKKIDELSVMVIGAKNEKKPMVAFRDIVTNENFLKNLENTYRDGPTVIQSYAIPYIIDDDSGDILLRSHTGSGKTAAYLVPIIMNIMKLKKEKSETGVRFSPYAVILVPTKELAIQVAKEGARIAKGTSVKISFLIGSICLSDCRINMEKNGCDIVVGTIGKVHQFFVGNESSFDQKEPFLRPDNMKYMVLDESDRLLDNDEAAKLIEGIRNVLSLNSTYQVIMNSATLNLNVYDERFLFLPMAITVGSNMPVDTVVQRFVNVCGHVPANVPNEHRLVQPGMTWKSHKIDFLIKLFKDYRTRYTQFPKCIVFVNTKRKSEVVAARLIKEGFKALSMNGNNSLIQRQSTVNALKMDKVDIIVGTDVISRGLNVPNVDVVVNYDLPVMRMEEYVHRIGRTGRMGNIGRAISFYDPMTDFMMATMVEKIMMSTDQQVPEFLEQTIAADCDTFLNQAMYTGFEGYTGFYVKEDIPAWVPIADDAVVEFI
ncbi:unnamed protein product [Bursaphelenchus okinawaensis]|uniref:RNA helicase n=1 Tax=Bursaphelenchus okinawaensis TaxID=465554 RepID=A0A811L869_9BILA|nr:unnamed protein product [Bursaphelenchus okinawaensis]CAG9118604.1 unnamed protein product [Bursaphelenchus okinawaensis]